MYLKEFNVLTIDVGLRNLAMCIMSCKDKKDLKTFDIHLWEVYNVLDEDDYKCQSILKNGKICNKKCSMKYNIDSIYYYCCKTHFPKNINITKMNQFKKKNIDSYLLQDIAKAFLEKIDFLYKSNELFKEISMIQIELQPMCNKKSLFTSHILYGKLVDIYKNTNTIIRFVRASTKLKAYTGPEIECKLKSAYAKRKWLSVQYGKWILENKFNQEQKEKWLNIFITHKKLDDLNDTFCFAVNALHGIPKIKDKNGKCIK